MNIFFKNLGIFIGMVLITNCSHLNRAPQSTSTDTVTIVAEVDNSNFNHDLLPNMLTADIALYRSKTSKISWEKLMEQIEYAKEIFRAASVQLNIIGSYEVEIPPTLQQISNDEFDGNPNEFIDNLSFYDHMDQEKAKLSKSAQALFLAVSNSNKMNLDPRTISIVLIDDAKLSWFEKNNGTWVKKTAETSAISFPPYVYTDRMPLALRGFITMQSISKKESYKKTIAHEIGHKLINVSHESSDACPGAEVVGSKGLMVYGMGTEISSGINGRWHLERLHLSPFLYTIHNHGVKKWNKAFEAYGKYSDPIYKNYMINSICK